MFGHVKAPGSALFCLLVAVAYPCSIDARAPDSRSLRVGIYQNEPKIFRDESGAPSGLFVDILEAIADREDWQLEFVDCSWEQCLDMLETSELDVMPDVAFTRSRADRFGYHDIKVVDSFSQFYAPASVDIQSFADLRGMRVATLAESSQHEEIRDKGVLVDEQIELVPAPSFHAAFQAVKDGKADAVVSNRFFGERNAPAYGLGAKALVFQPAQLYYTVPPGEHADILNTIDEHLARWKSEAPSPYYASLQRWTGKDLEKATPSWVWYLVLGTLIALGLAALIIGILRYQVAVRTRHLHERNEDLRKNQRHLSLIVDHGPDLVLHIDLENDVVYVNSAIETITGRDSESVLGTSFPALFSPPLDEQTFAELRRATNESHTFELSLEHTDGSEIPVELRVGSIADEEGNPWMLQVTMRDLSERVEAIEARRQSEARAQRIIKSLPLAAIVWRATADGIVLELLNDSAVELFDESSSAWVGASLSELFPDEHPIAQLVKRCLEHEAGERLETEIKLSDSSEELTLVLFSGFLEPDSVLVHIEDVTERAMLRRQLQVSQRLETAGLLAGGVAHDFNNLLTVINSNARLALMEIDESSTAHEDVQQILQAGEKAANVTSQLLTFTRQSETEPQLICLSETVGQLTDMLHHFIPESVSLTVDLQAEDDWILIDPTQIEQVVMNLVVNARDAIEQKQQGEVHISTRVVPEERTAILEVSDSGEGMDEETLQHVFEPFFSTKEKDRGTGLGLSMVYGAVTGANGTIDIDSQPGSGTRVIIELPLAKEADVIELGGRSGPFLANPGESVLVVEDEDSVRLVVERIVKRAGYEVFTADSTDAALEILGREDDVSVVLTDVVMPERSGAYLVERIREEFPEVQTLFMSGYTNNELGVHGISDEDHALIKKPFAPQELAERLREILDNRRPPHALA